MSTSLITNNILEAIEQLQSPWNPRMYARDVIAHEQENERLQKELGELNEFIGSTMYSHSNGSVIRLVENRTVEIEKRMTRNESELQKYFSWTMEYLK